MILTASAAMWFLPFVLPICLYVAWSDLSSMKIPNRAVMALVVVFAVLGLLLIPFEAYVWGYAALVVVLLIGILANATGTVGAGDAKFAAAASPFIAWGDFTFVLVLLAVTTVAAFVIHRIARATALRRMVPDWASWTSGKRFPMGFPLAGTLALYLGLKAGGVI